MLSDDQLFAKLRAYTKRVASSLSYADCVRLHESGDRMVEYEGTEGSGDFLTYAWEILDLEVFENARSGRLHTHVCDDRDAGLDSVYTPLCSGASIFEDGRTEFHSLGNLAASHEAIDF
jgi:hypothetical protein